MSQQHRRPLFALLLIAIACAGFMSYSLRAQALIGVIANGETRALVKVSQRVLLGAAEAEPNREELTRSATVADDDLRSAAPRKRVKRAETAGDSATAKLRSRTTPGTKVSRFRSTEDREGSERAATPVKAKKHNDTQRRRKQPSRTTDPGSRGDDNRDDGWGNDQDIDRGNDWGNDRTRRWGNDRDIDRDIDGDDGWGNDGDDGWGNDRTRRWGNDRH